MCSPRHCPCRSSPVADPQLFSLTTAPQSSEEAARGQGPCMLWEQGAGCPGTSLTRRGASPGLGGMQPPSAHPQPPLTWRERVHGRECRGSTRWARALPPPSQVSGVRPFPSAPVRLEALGVGWGVELTPRVAGQQGATRA